ncbi:uncharacterized protein [Misgurnus anguillicaudatus]|uniref:uncharacterized protein n=1 Tax=Misgurnus anguillicaudatus TaxID=75329 RepID=UPI003CCF7D24
MSNRYLIPGYHSNPNDTLHKGGRDAPNAPLHEIEKNLLAYLGTFLRQAEEEIENKYSIKKDDTSLWPVDDIKKAWGKTQRMNLPHENNRREHWSVVIILQMLLKKESEYDATNTQSELKEDLTGSNSYDCPAETQHYSGDSADNIPEETKPRKRGNRAGKDSENSENDKTESKRSNIAADNASEKSSSDSVPQGIYIPLTKFSISDKQPPIQKQKDRLKFIDGEPKFHNQNENRYELFVRTSSVVKYDNEKLNAAWVFEKLNNQTINGPANSNYKFCFDESTNKNHRAPKSLGPYSDTDYDRGHLAAAANHKWCQEANDDTFFLSNIVPQHKDLNRGKWKRLEELCRQYVQDEDYSNAYIYTGPLYCPEKYLTEKGITEEANVEKEKKKKEKIMRDFMSKFGKALPTHFFKVIILEKKDGERELKCYEISNEGKEEQQKPNEAEEEQKQQQQKIKQKIKSIEEDLIKFSTNIDSIETDSGLTFTEKNPKILREEEKEVTDMTDKMAACNI